MVKLLLRRSVRRRQHSLSLSSSGLSLVAGEASALQGNPVLRCVEGEVQQLDVHLCFSSRVPRRLLVLELVWPSRGPRWTQLESVSLHAVDIIRRVWIGVFHDSLTNLL